MTVPYQWSGLGDEHLDKSGLVYESLFSSNHQRRLINFYKPVLREAKARS